MQRIDINLDTTLVVLHNLAHFSIKNEDNEHFLLQCHQFDSMQQDLLDQRSDIPRLNVNQDDQPF